MTADGRTVLAGDFELPYDFGSGTFYPRGRDGFVLAIDP
jgi:hypothetical protein